MSLLFARRVTFLNPLLLLGLAAAAIPIAVHLFNFRRPKRVAFSSLAFLREQQASTMQRVKVKQWLLLALRILALACLGLAFARPIVEGWAGNALGRPASSVAIVVDTSPSMLRRDAGGELLDQAKALGASLVGELDAGDEFFVLTTSPGDPSLALRTPGAALDALRELNVSYAGQPLTQAIARAAGLLESAAHPLREIYVVSDLQRSTLADSARSAIGFDGRVVLLGVGDTDLPDVGAAVTDVRVESRIVQSGQPVQLRATITNTGARDLTDYGVRVDLEGVQVAQQTIDVPQGETVDVLMTLTPRRTGWLGGQVAVEADGFEADDARAFALNVPQRTRVLVAQGTGADARYVRTALDAARGADGSLFDVTYAGSDALVTEPLDDFDALILLGAQSSADGVVGRLARYVQSGGGILAFADAQPGGTAALVQAVGGGSVSPARGTPGDPLTMSDRVEREHPVFDRVFGRDDRQAEAIAVQRYAPYSAGRSGERTLIRLASGDPLVQEIPSGEGILLLVTASPDPTWTDLPTRGLWLPLVYRSLLYLASGDAAQGAQLRPGQSASLAVPSADRYAVIGPQGDERAADVRVGAAGPRLETGGLTDRPGVYTVRADGADVLRFGVGLDARESLLESASRVGGFRQCYSRYRAGRRDRIAGSGRCGGGPGRAGAGVGRARNLERAAVALVAFPTRRNRRRPPLAPRRSVYLIALRQLYTTAARRRALFRVSRYVVPAPPTRPQPAARRSRSLCGASAGTDTGERAAHPACAVGVEPPERVAQADRARSAHVRLRARVVCCPGQRVGRPMDLLRVSICADRVGLDSGCAAVVARHRHARRHPGRH